MALTGIGWKDLPAATKAMVQQHTGPVRSARSVSEGRNSAVAALLTTSHETVFVKGLHRDHTSRPTQDIEWMISPYVVQVAPRLLWRADEGEWDLLGFEAIDGRHAVLV